MKTVTQTMLYRQALIKYSLKYGVTKAAIRCKTNPHFNGYIIEGVESLVWAKCFDKIFSIFPIQLELKYSDFYDYFISFIAPVLLYAKGENYQLFDTSELVRLCANAHGTLFDDYAHDYRCPHHEHGYEYGCAYVRGCECDYARGCAATQLCP